jgi:hypothetical protein
MGLTIYSGLHAHLRAPAARLYWEAFGGKLGRVLGPDAKALAYFERVIRTDHCLAALDETGTLVGLAGFKTPSGSFAGGSWADLTGLRAVGRALAGHRALRRLGNEVDNDRFLDRWAFAWCEGASWPGNRFSASGGSVSRGGRARLSLASGWTSSQDELLGRGPCMSATGSGRHAPKIWGCCPAFLFGFAVVDHDGAALELCPRWTNSGHH